MAKRTAQVVSVVLTLLLGLACSRDYVEIVDISTVVAPTVDRFSPLAGLAGQTVVKVEGKDFPEDARVYFGTQQGVWAIGPNYVYSDTTLYAIPPFGSASEVAISIRGATGQAQAQVLFQVFDSEPEITGISHERIHNRTELVIEGQSFNRTDANSHLYLADKEILSFDVTTTRITAQVSSTTSFVDIPTGWKLLRYTYTPYVDGGNDETATAVYVAQDPNILRVDDTGFVGGALQLIVEGYDGHITPVANSFADNIVEVGTQPAPIVGVRLNDPAPGLARVLVTAPPLALGLHRVVFRTFVGSSNIAASPQLRILGSGQLGFAPQPGTCYNFGAIAAAGYNIVREDRMPKLNHFISRIEDTNPATGSFSPLGSITGVINTSGSQPEAVWQPRVGGANLPLQVFPVKRLFGENVLGAIVVSYGVSGLNQRIDLAWISYDFNSAAWTQCDFATASTPWQAPFDVQQALGGEGLDVRVRHVPSPDGLDMFGNLIYDDGYGRIFVFLRGPVWSGVFEKEIPPDVWKFNCPAVPEQLAPAIDLSSEPKPLIHDADVDSRGQRLYFSLRTTNAMGNVATELMISDVSALPIVGQTYVYEQLVGQFPQFDCPVPMRLLATSFGLLGWTNNILCALDVASLGATGFGSISRYSASANSSCNTNCGPMIMSPDEQEVWLSRSITIKNNLTVGLGPYTWTAMDRYAVATGIPQGSVSIDSTRAIVGMRYQSQGESIELQTIPNDNLLTVEEMAQRTAIEVCEVR